MKKTSILTITSAFLLLDWLALDDITTGSQPSYFWEYAIIVISIFIVGAVLFSKKF